MLLAIREKAQGWFAWLIVGFITIPFALWGIQSYLGVSSDPAAANVDGKEITQRQVEQGVRDFRNRLRNQLGKAYRPELFKDEMLRKQVMEQLINDAVLSQTAEDWKLRISDNFVRQYIQSIPSFQTNGKFNVQAYNTLIRNQGMSQRSFEEEVRGDLVMEQMRYGISDSAFATDKEVNDSIRLKDQERELAYLTVSGRKLAGDYAPTEEELDAYYKEHVKKYMVPERVKLEYLLLSPEVLGADMEVTEEKLREYYSQHQDEFQAPEERKLRHILIKLDENADQAAVDAAKAKADDLEARLAKSEKFEDLAKEFSDDPGSREQGGDLGWISPGLMAKAFEEAAYKLKKGEVSQPVRTPFGFHIIQVVDIRNPDHGGFESRRADIEAAWRRKQAEQVLFDKSEQLADLSYESPDSLVPAAETLGLKVQESGWIDRRGGKGDLASPKVVAAAFSDDVLNEGNNSELIELEGDKVLVLRVIEHEAEHPQTFEEVKDKVAAALKRDKGKKLAKEKGEALLASLKAGDKTLEQIAGDGAGELKSGIRIKRQSTALPQAVREKAFGLSRPKEGSPSFGGVELGNGDYALLALTGVTDGDPSKLDDAARKTTKQELARAKGQQQFNILGRYLRERADVEISTKDK
ncbi:SurA N-terminal domain-containing protein [Thiolapillus brandeum]|uniref:Periplasmic chaperone PpiD n=1 Tax=Thiolapillus brandeum TaxID=1076588 RepID=A0A7U6GHC6_9GAMM|nr:SurA N-terminal domain-containing protein [Thiolapillus brandeum]BAO43661.1 peptidyl-prolyl cis-trans isomerase D [Thiolapillus brandeum]